MILQEEIYRGSLYWMTNSYSNVLEMLTKNSMQLKPRISKIKITGFPYKEIYYKSFSRLKMGGYARTKLLWGEKDTALILEFDGEKLNRNFKIKPFSFYDWKDDGGRGLIVYNENEEILVSDKPEIKNIRSYIKAIHFYSSKVENIGDLYDFNIPVYVHTKEGLEHLRKGEKNPPSPKSNSNKPEIKHIPLSLRAVYSMFFPKDKQEPNSQFKVDDLLKTFRLSGNEYNSERRDMMDAILKEARKRGIRSVKDFKVFFEKNTVKKYGGVL
jgi:hypothetical protein